MKESRALLHHTISMNYTEEQIHTQKAWSFNNDNYFGAFGLVFGQNLAWLGFWSKLGLAWFLANLT